MNEVFNGARIRKVENMLFIENCLAVEPMVFIYQFRDLEH